jgi:hypothetical protein
MKDRLVTLLGALLALAIFYALFLRQPGEPPVTKPLSVEAGRNGYLGVKTWLERQDVRVVSLRERYGRLLETGDLPEAGNVLIVTMPFRTPLRTSEVEPLRQWVRNGNTLLVLAALDDSPEWAAYADGSFPLDLVTLTGLGFMTPSEAAAAPESQTAFERPPIAAGTAVELEPLFEHPLLEGVDALRGYSDGESAVWVMRSADPDRLVLRLAYETSSGLDALWQSPQGDGQIIVSASGSLLANRNIGTGAARELVRNLVRHHVARDGAVIFDDMHHGLSTLYDAAALFRDERLTATIWFVLAAWVVYILGSSNRLAPPRAPRAVPRQADFLAAAGGFMARRIEKAAAGLLLLNEWLDEVRRARGLPRDAPPWSELDATPALARGVLEELRGYHRKLTAGQAVDMVRLHNALRAAREAIG